MIRVRCREIRKQIVIDFLKEIWYNKRTLCVYLVRTTFSVCAGNRAQEIWYNKRTLCVYLVRTVFSDMRRKSCAISMV